MTPVGDHGSATGDESGGDPAARRVVVTPGVKTFTANFKSTEMPQTGAYSWLLSSGGRQSGTFTVDFDLFADVMSDGDAGVVVSDGTDPAQNGFGWEDFAARIRLSSGKLQARHIDDYCPEGPSPPCVAASVAPRYIGLDELSGGSAKLYHFRLVIDYPSHTYSSYARNVSDDLAEVTIGLDYQFSTDWTEGPNGNNSATGMSAWSAWPDLSGTGATGSLRVANFAVTP